MESYNSTKYSFLRVIARRNEQARLLNLADSDQVDKPTGKTPKKGKKVKNPPVKDDPMDTFDEVPAMENNVPLRVQEPMDIASRMKAHADAFVALQAELAVVGHYPGWWPPQPRL